MLTDMTDILHEIAIRLIMKLCIAATRISRWACDTHKRLVLGRSPRQIERMERAIRS